MSRYRSEITVRLKDTDAAGVLFFANQLVLAHEVFEALMDEIGMGLRGILEAGELILPIVHAEADYLGPLRVGDRLSVELFVSRLGESSFTLDYELFAADGAQRGTCRTVHVAVNPRAQDKVSLPDALRDGLKAFRET